MHRPTRCLTETHAHAPAHFAAAIDIDLSNTVYDHFPITIGAVGGLVFVLMLIAFRSVVLAIKSVTTITITLSLVYGLAKFVYQDGVYAY